MKNNKKNIVEPQIYSLLLESPNVLFLSIQCAMSLEEATLLAKMEFEKLNSLKPGSKNPLSDAKISLFAIKTLDEFADVTIAKRIVKNIVTNIDKELGDTIAILKKTVEEIPFPDLLLPGGEKEINIPKLTKKEAQIKEKNDLMKQIVQKKDKRMFQKNKLTFSKVECAYLKDQLK